LPSLMAGMVLRYGNSIKLLQSSGQVLVNYDAHSIPRVSFFRPAGRKTIHNKIKYPAAVHPEPVEGQAKAL